MSGPLDHSAADIIRNLLIDLGHGTAPSDAGAWPVYVSVMPNSPDSTIVVIDQTGELQGKLHPISRVVEREGVQILVRDAQHFDGHNKADNIAKGLDAVSQVGVRVGDVAGTGDATYTVHAVTRRSGPIALGKETPNSKRNLWSINVVSALRQTS